MSGVTVGTGAATERCEDGPEQLHKLEGKVQAQVCPWLGGCFWNDLMALSIQKAHAESDKWRSLSIPRGEADAGHS